jgi:DNA mismatch repair protein MutS2
MIAPVVGSGDWPAWIARVPKPCSWWSVMGEECSVARLDSAEQRQSGGLGRDPMRSRYNLEALEFQSVRVTLMPLLRTPLGRTGVEAAGPLPDAAAARRELATVREIAARMADGDLPPLPHLEELRGWLAPFFGGDHLPTIAELVALKRALGATDACRGWLGSLGRWSGCQELAATFPAVGDIADGLDAVIDASGEVRSTASVKLARIREEIEVAELGVRRAVQKFLGDDRVYRHLQTPEPAWRNGRPVFQVRYESRGAVAGVLHDRSSSGATLFIEPEVVVAAANALSDARAAEHREIQVLLAQVSRALRRYELEILAAVACLVHLDVTQAKARLVTEAGYAVPAIREDGVLRLEAARHPLLLQTLSPEVIEALTFDLGDRFSVLVVTGPNTGGKTVVLKTVGLLSLMALSGMPIPAAATSEVPFFDGVFVDIGDEQGISQNLSTFSSHIARIAHCLEAATARSLVLIDELGAGTDPEEGGALGYAVLARLERERVRAVVTTHLGRLKDFAYQHPGAENGSMAFDRDSHRPLYRLELGIPGASHALDIAARVGMPADIVAAARQLLGRRDERLEEAIARVHDTRREAEADRRETAARSRAAGEKEARLAGQIQELQRKGAWLEEEADMVVEEALRGLRQRWDTSLKRLANAPKPFGEVANELLEDLGREIRSTGVHRRRMKFLGALRKDGVVYVPRLARRCTVKKVDRTREMLTIEVGKMRMEIPFEDASWLQPLD